MKAHFMMSVSRYQRDKINKTVSVKRPKVWGVKEEDSRSLNRIIHFEKHQFDWCFSYFEKHGF